MEKAGMRTIFLSWLVLAAVWVPQAARSASPNGHWDYMQASALKWRAYDPGTLRKAAELKRPLFVLVYLDTCHWCRKYETETLETDRILKRLRTDYLPVAVNSAVQPGLAKQLGASMVPTTILLTPEGRVMAKFKGFVDARDLADILDANLYRWRKGEIGGEEFGEPEVCCPLETVPK
jgi:thiol:disulfide interchange protein